MEWVTSQFNPNGLTVSAQEKWASPSTPSPPPTCLKAHKPPSPLPPKKSLAHLFSDSGGSYDTWAAGPSGRSDPIPVETRVSRGFGQLGILRPVLYSLKTPDREPGAPSTKGNNERRCSFPGMFKSIQMPEQLVSHELFESIIQCIIVYYQN